MPASSVSEPPVLQPTPLLSWHKRQNNNVPDVDTSACLLAACCSHTHAPSSTIWQLDTSSSDNGCCQTASYQLTCVPSFTSCSTHAVDAVPKTVKAVPLPSGIASVNTAGEQEESEGLIGAGGGVAVAAPAPVTAPAAAVDEGSSLLSHDEQQEAFFADPTANGAAPGMALHRRMYICCVSTETMRGLHACPCLTRVVTCASQTWLGWLAVANETLGIAKS